MKARAMMVILGGAIAVAVAVLAATLTLGGSSRADVEGVADRPDPAKVAKSTALTRANAIRPGLDSPVRVDRAALSGATARIAARIPLPDGANYNGIRFDDAVAQGGLRDDTLERLLQANAACQWYVALAAGREVATARAIIPEIADWSGVRIDAVWDKPTSDFATGGSGGAFAQMTATCEETRADQRRYALQHGLEPTI